MLLALTHWGWSLNAGGVLAMWGNTGPLTKLPTSCVTRDKLLSHSGPLLPLLQNGSDNSNYLIRFLRG